MNVHLIIHIASGVLIATLAYVLDRLNARRIQYQTIMRMYVEKSVQDRNKYVRIPAEMVVEMFHLGDQEVSEDFALLRKPYPKHPSMMRLRNRGVRHEGA